MNKPKLLLSGEAFIGEDGKLYETTASYSQKLADLSYKIADAVMQGVIQRPTVAIAVPRGGLMATEYVARALDIKGQYVVGCSISTFTNKTKSGNIAQGQLPTKDEINGHWVIVTEDVADTGETLEEVTKTLTERGAAGIISAAVYWKRQCKEPDFWISDTKSPGQWIVFPTDPLEEFGMQFSKYMKNNLEQTA